MFGRAAQGVANLALVLFIVRILEPVDYGAYMALWGLTEMLVPLSSLGLLEAVRRFLPELASRGAARSVSLFVKWSTIARASILLVWTVFLLIAWETITEWMGFSQVQAGQTIHVIGMAVLVVSFRYACEMLECLLEQRWSQTVRAIHPIGRLIGLGVLFLQNQVTLATVLWVEVAVSLICLLLAEWALIRKLRGLMDAGAYRVSARDVAQFAGHLLGANLLQSIGSEGAQRLLVARFLGLEVAGLFSFLQQLTIIVSRYFPAQLLANVIRPMLISRLAAGKNDEVTHGLALMWKSNLVIVMGCVAVLASSGDELVALISSERFISAGMPAVVFFLGIGATSQGQVMNMAMQIQGRTQALLKLSIIFGLVPLAVWLGSALDLLGALLGIVMVLWLRNLIAMWLMNRQGIGIAVDLTGVSRMLLVSVLAALVGYWVAVFSNTWFAIFVTVMILGMGMLLARPLNAADAALMERVLKGRARFLKLLIRTVP